MSAEVTRSFSTTIIAIISSQKQTAAEVVKNSPLITASIAMQWSRWRWRWGSSSSYITHKESDFPSNNVPLCARQSRQKLSKCTHNENPEIPSNALWRPAHASRWGTNQGKRSERLPESTAYSQFVYPAVSFAECKNNLWKDRMIRLRRINTCTT